MKHFVQEKAKYLKHQLQPCHHSRHCTKTHKVNEPFTLGLSPVSPSFESEAPFDHHYTGMCQSRQVTEETETQTQVQTDPW